MHAKEKGTISKEQYYYLQSTNLSEEIPLENKLVLRVNISKNQSLSKVIWILLWFSDKLKFESLINKINGKLVDDKWIRLWNEIIKLIIYDEKIPVKVI